MSFEDLPANVSQLPLTTSQLRADVIDLIILEEDRAAGCVGLMVCDSEDRGVQPVVFKEVPDDAGRVEFGTFLDLVLPLVGETNGSVIIELGLAEPGPPTRTALGTSRPSSRVVSTVSDSSASTSPPATESSPCRSPSNTPRSECPAQQRGRGSVTPERSGVAEPHPRP